MMKKLLYWAMKAATTILFAGHTEYHRKPKKQLAQEFKYCSYSRTVRLMPQNYLVAITSYGHLIADPDAAIDDKLASRIFIMLRQHDVKFSNEIDNVVASLNTLLNP
jgi:hypothetical protein